MIKRSRRCRTLARATPYPRRLFFFPLSKVFVPRRRLLVMVNVSLVVVRTFAVSTPPRPGVASFDFFWPPYLTPALPCLRILTRKENLSRRIPLSLRFSFRRVREVFFPPILVEISPPPLPFCDRKRRVFSFFFFGRGRGVGHASRSSAL